MKYIIWDKLVSLRTFLTLLHLRMNRIILLIVFYSMAINAQAQHSVSREEVSTQKQALFAYPEPTHKERYNIAVLTPLYLDSVDLSKSLTKIPKYMMPGIDFYQGVRIAADTLNKLGHKFNLFIFDSKSSYLDVNKLINSDRLDSMDLIIGNASVSDLKLLADFAKKNEINFVSAVSPSDASQTTNPYFTLLQPRLITHIEKIHGHINRKFPENNVLFLHRNQTAELNALHYFEKDPLNKVPSRYSTLEMKGDDIEVQEIRNKLDSNYVNTIVLDVLDAGITYNMLKKINTLTADFNINVFCMPTTEAIRSLGKTDEFPGMPVYYTASYIIDRITPASMYVARQYKKYMGGAVTDIVYKGFESLYFFAHLLKKYGTPYNNHISDNTYTFITPYKIMPVRVNKEFQYFENKYLYMVRYENGIVTYE